MGLTLRAVALEDVGLLFEWANDPVVRHGSFDPAPIPCDDHGVWFASQLVALGTAEI